MGGTVLVTGAAGQLGTFIVQTFADREVVGTTRATLDITDAASVQRVLSHTQPTLIVNCAAFNDVDGAEDAAIDALAVNSFGVRNLSRAAEACGATLVHYSSDFVFDGTASRPYHERDTAAPRSTYAASKLLGEWFALDVPNAFVLRVESLFGCPPTWTGRRGTLDTLVEGLRTGRELRVFTDRTVSPSYLPDVAVATRHLVESGAAPGLYHCVNSGEATWADVVQEAAAVLGVTPDLQRITSDQVRMKAARPRYCALSNDKLASTGLHMPTWQDALRRWLSTDRQSAA